MSGGACARKGFSASLRPMPTPKRTKPSIKNRSRVHRDRVKSARRKRLRARAETQAMRAKRRARLAARVRKVFGRRRG